MKQLRELRLAFMLLSRLPVGSSPPPAELSASAWAWPLVGLVVGVLSGLVFMLASGSGLPISIAALLALATQMLLTGAMHEDGLADTLDGFGGSTERARKLEIMRDSRIGTYGVLGLVMSVVLRWTALTAIAEPWTVLAAMACIGAASRAPLPLLSRILPGARSEGVGAAAKQQNFAPSLLALAFGTLALALLTLLGQPGFTAFSLIMLVAALMGLLSCRQIGGHTGDTQGATQQLCETAALLAIAT